MSQSDSASAATTAPATTASGVVSDGETAAKACEGASETENEREIVGFSDDTVYDVVFRSSEGWTGFDVLVELAQAIDEMPTTKTRFAPRRQLPDEVRPWLYPDRLITLLGAWPVPDRFHTGRRTVFVNPYSVHAQRYADVLVECECGAYMAHHRSLPTETKAETEHRPDCTTEWRMDARERLPEKRLEWVKEAAELFLTAEQAARRMGVHPASVETIAERNGYDWSELRLRGRSRMVNTWMQLRQNGESSTDIGTAFGKPDSTVRSYTTGNAIDMSAFGAESWDQFECE